MRGKRAKLLRRLAEQVTIGHNENNYVKTPRGEIRLQNCTRRIYRDLKKQNSPLNSGT